MGPHLGRIEFFGFTNPGACTITTVSSRAAISGPAGTTVDGEHPVDRMVYPVHALVFLQSGTILLRTGDQVQVLGPFFTFDELSEFGDQEYRLWVPGGDIPRGSFFYDVAEALGSTSNPTVMTNLETNLNILKGRLFTTDSRALDKDTLVRRTFTLHVYGGFYERLPYFAGETNIFFVLSLSY